jgi:predicted dehydrogenase
VAAARAGKHVLLEKPMALTLADADAAVAAARTAGVRLGVSFQRRTEPGYQALHEAIAEGALGRLVLGAATVPYYRGPEYFASAAWRGTWAMDGGGVLMNQGIHLADLLVWLLGEVEEVHATATTAVRDIEVEDCLAATLRFASGARGAFVGTTAAAPGFPHRLEVYGERGGAQVEGDVVVRWEAGERRPPVASGPVSAGAGASATSIAPTGHARILADFVEAVREGRDPMVTGEDGRRSLALVLAIYEAARTGRAVTPAPFGRANLSARRGDRASRRGPNRSRRRRGAPSR